MSISTCGGLIHWAYTFYLFTSLIKYTGLKISFTGLSDKMSVEFGLDICPMTSSVLTRK